MSGPSAESAVVEVRGVHGTPLPPALASVVVTSPLLALAVENSALRTALEAARADLAALRRQLEAADARCAALEARVRAPATPTADPRDYTGGGCNGEGGGLREAELETAVGAAVARWGLPGVGVRRAGGDGDGGDEGGVAGSGGAVTRRRIRVAMIGGVLCALGSGGESVALEHVLKQMCASRGAAARARCAAQHAHAVAGDVKTPVAAARRWGAPVPAKASFSPDAVSGGGNGDSAGGMVVVGGGTSRALPFERPPPSLSEFMDRAVPDSSASVAVAVNHSIKAPESRGAACAAPPSVPVAAPTREAVAAARCVCECVCVGARGAACA